MIGTTFSTPRDAAGQVSQAPVPSEAQVPSEVEADAGDFDAWFAVTFRSSFERIFRYLNRSCGDPELSSDLAQEAFIRLYRRGSAPASPNAWLAAVAMNLLRNARSKASRRRRLMSVARAERAHSEPAPPPDDSLAGRSEGAVDGIRVRSALDRMPERSRSILLLRGEGFSYREIADAMRLTPSSVGTMLARAKAEFRSILQEVTDAPGS